MVIIYDLGLKDVPFVFAFFPHLYIFAIVAISTLTPISILIGLYHLRRTGAFSAEASVSTESNPYMYKAIPGKEREVFLPIMIMTLRGLSKVMERQQSLTETEREQFRAVLEKADSLLQGAPVGVPKGRTKKHFDS